MKSKAQDPANAHEYYYRMKAAHKTPIGKGRKDTLRKVRPQRRQGHGEAESEVPLPGPIPSCAPLIEYQQPVHQSPDRDDRRFLDTPTPRPSPWEARSDYRIDPTYVPSDTPRSRKELGPTRDSPPFNQITIAFAKSAGNAGGRATGISVDNSISEMLNHYAVARRLPK